MILEPLDPETVREEAFMAPAWTWHGQPLHPLAVSREADWLLHCRRIGLPPLEEALGSTESFAAHALRLLWFVSHEPREWLAVWMAGGAGAPVFLDGRIREWLDSNVPSEESGAAVALAIKIYNRIDATRALPVDEGGGDEIAKKAPGPVDAPNTSTPSPEPALVSSPKSSSATTSPKSEAGPTSTATSPRRASSTNGPRKPRKKKPRS